MDFSARWPGSTDTALLPLHAAQDAQERRHGVLGHQSR